MNEPSTQPIETPAKLNAFQQEMKLPLWAFMFLYAGAVTAGYGGGMRAALLEGSTHWLAYGIAGLGLIFAPAIVHWVGKTLWPAKRVDA